MIVAVKLNPSGKISDVYKELLEFQEEYAFIFDLLIICGDLKGAGNKYDFSTFDKYYHGSKVAPVMTLLIAGKLHPKSRLHKSHYGVWVAPEIYFMGKVGVVRYGNLIIGAISGEFRIMTASNQKMDLIRLSQMKHIDMMIVNDMPPTVLPERKRFLDRVRNLCCWSKESSHGTTTSGTELRLLLQQIKADNWYIAAELDEAIQHGIDNRTDIEDNRMKVIILSDKFKGDSKLKHDKEWFDIMVRTMDDNDVIPVLSSNKIKYSRGLYYKRDHLQKKVLKRQGQPYLFNSNGDDSPDDDDGDDESNNSKCFACTELFPDFDNILKNLN